MKVTQWIRIGLTDSWIVVFLRLLAVLLFLGALSHIGSIVGLIGGPWTTKPLHFRIADLLMLSFNLVVGWGLWRTKYWAVLAWIVGLFLFQIVPFAFFADVLVTDPVHRQILRRLAGTSVTLILAFLILLFFRCREK